MNNDLSLVTLAEGVYPFGAVNIVPEGEESIWTEGHSLQRTDPVLFLNLWQSLRNLVKQTLPNLHIWTLMNKKKLSISLGKTPRPSKLQKYCGA